jgi:hypothetical protein
MFTTVDAEAGGGSITGFVGTTGVVIDVGAVTGEVGFAATGAVIGDTITGAVVGTPGVVFVVGAVTGAGVPATGAMAGAVVGTATGAATAESLKMRVAL